MISDIQPILQDILYIITGGILLYIGELLYYLIRLIKLKLSLSTHDIATQTVEDVVRKAVIYTNNTYVDDLKDLGEFDKRSQNNAKIKTKQLIQSELNPIMFSAQGTSVSDLDKWLDLLIEAKVDEVKHS